MPCLLVFLFIFFNGGLLDLCGIYTNLGLIRVKQQKLKIIPLGLNFHEGKNN